MELSEAIRDRYSVRKFKEEQIEEDVMMEILSVLEHSPTALNYQPEKVYRLKSAEAMEKINSASKCIYGAPGQRREREDHKMLWMSSKM